MNLSRQHPLRVLLDQAAIGGPLPSRAQLDELLDRDDLPDGMNLTRFRSAITTAAKECKALSERGDHAAARQHAERRVAEMAEKMSDEERGIANTHDPAAAESSEDIGARMFGGH